VVIGDMRDYNSLLNATTGVDYIIHAAGIVAIEETEAMKQLTLETNVTGMLNLLEAAEKNEVSRILYTSTCHVYGAQEKLPISEDATAKPRGIYAVSKKAAEDVCKTFMHDLDIVIVRSFNKYGERQEPTYLIPRIITQALLRQEVQLGNPTPTRDYIHISDAVQGYLLVLLKAKAGEIYNLSSGIEISVEQLANKLLREILKSDVPIKWNYKMRSTVDIPRLCGDSSKARSELGWAPKVDLDSGLERTVAWFRRTPSITRS